MRIDALALQAGTATSADDPHQVYLMAYNPTAIADFFDSLGAREWERFDKTLGDRVSLSLHTDLLERFVRPGDRLLDIGAGPGRFTEILHRLKSRIVVADLSRKQLALNREAAQVRGFAASVEGWHQLDICDLGTLATESFDGVVAFGGPFSYVFDLRGRALAECTRVLRPGGYLLLRKLCTGRCNEGDVSRRVEYYD